MSEQKTIVIANWKMKLNLDQSQSLALALKKVRRPGVEVVVCPSFVSLSVVSTILKKSEIILGAQDVFWEEPGAFTGEISADELKALGCQYVIIGHSERRVNLGETDKMINKKIKAALNVGLKPVICVGENYEQRQKGQQDQIIIDQLTKGLEGVKLEVSQQLIVAYEPIWAIGVSQAINPSQAKLAHQVIRQTLVDVFPLELVNNNIRIIYGGSVDSVNAASFTGLDNTNGVLVSSASVAAKEFIEIINNV